MLCGSSGVEAQLTYQETYSQSVYNGAVTGGAGGIEYQVSKQFSDTSGIGTSISVSNGVSLQYTASGTVSVSVTGGIPNVANNCQATTTLSLSAPQLVRYLYSFSYTGQASLPQLSTGFSLQHDGLTIGSADNPVSSVTGTGVIDLSDGEPLQLPTWVGANLTSTSSASFAIDASFQTIPASTIPIGGAQPTTGNAIWTQPISGNWSNQTSWLQNVLPGTGINTFFNTGSPIPYTVAITSNQNAGSLTLQGDDVTLALGSILSLGPLTVDGFGARNGVLTLFGPGTLSAVGGLSPVTVTSSGNLAVNDATLSATGFSIGPSIAVAGGGTLSISNGGKVVAASANLSASSLLALTVGDGSSLGCDLQSFFPGDGVFTDFGVIRLKAAAGAAPGNTYKPITAASWSGSPTVQALGGTWNSSTHTFTASAIATAAAGNPVSVDLSQKQRLQITDAGSNQSVAASFPASLSPSTLTFTASLLTGAQSAQLGGIIGSTTTVDAGWTFIATGYTTGAPVFLSMDIGSGYSTSELAVWHYDGTTWAPFSTSDLTYDGSYAGFTVSGFSGYAVVSPTSVPEPAFTSLMMLIGAGWLRRRNLQKHG